MDPSYNDFLKMVLPEAICDYFELTGYKKDSDQAQKLWGIKNNQNFTGT